MQTNAQALKGIFPRNFDNAADDPLSITHTHPNIFSYVHFVVVVQEVCSSLERVQEKLLQLTKNSGTLFGIIVAPQKSNRLFAIVEIYLRTVMGRSPSFLSHQKSMPITVKCGAKTQHHQHPESQTQRRMTEN